MKEAYLELISEIKTVMTEKAAHREAALSAKFGRLPDRIEVVG